MDLLRKAKGQASIEYLMIFGLALMLSAPFITKAQSSILDLRSDSEILDVRNSVDRIENAAETVNAAGVPAKRTFFIKLPNNVEEVYVSENSFVYTVTTHDGTVNVTKQFDFRIGGDLPVDEGKHQISVTAKSDQVEISEVS